MTQPTRPGGPTDDRLLELIEEARNHVMTPREKWQQRVSFVYGNMPFSSTVTREQVEAQITEEYGPCPEK